MPISVEDYISISDFMGRYCWAVDEGLGKEWSELWTEDGAFVGVAPEPVVGREALSFIATHTHETFNGGMRHMFGNLHADYGDDRDIVNARFYNYVSLWGPESRNFTFAICEARLVRHGDSWRLQRNEVRLLAPAAENLTA